MTLRVDPHRASLCRETGILVRALTTEGTYGNVDIAHLDKESLDAWLRSRDSIEWPISTVMILLGHR